MRLVLALGVAVVILDGIAAFSQGAVQDEALVYTMGLKLASR